MSKKYTYILLYLLIAFSIYCALTIGESWDEQFGLSIGKNTLDYLFSLGVNDNYIFAREYFSGIYWTFLYFLTMIFPAKFQIEVSHLINLIFSLGTIFGIGKVSKMLFNQKVGQLTFIILFFYPIFFGHMAFNSKDTIIAFSHVWIAYLVLKYLKNQDIKDKTNNYIFFIGILAALSTGIQLIFLGSLIPIFLFVLFEIFLFKKFINKNFNKKKFLYDLLKCFVIFYFLLILFWIDTHSNFLVLPFNIIMEYYSGDYWTGWPYNLVNGDYYLSREIPKFYLLINFIYKSPEYLLISYVLFIIIMLKSKIFFNKKFKNFNYKLSLLLLILIFPNVILYLIPYPVYDGMRLFLWVLPYICIIPGLTIYYFIENFNSIKSKIALLFLSFFIIHFLFSFFLITPYQYTYLNMLNGKVENRYKKFENDYWGSSIKELIKNTSFKSDKLIKIATCGVAADIPKNYLKKKGHLNFMFVTPSQADYIIMTNRVSFDLKNKVLKNPINCFDKFIGENVSTVIRNGVLLSVIRKIKI